MKSDRRKGLGWLAQIFSTITDVERHEEEFGFFSVSAGNLLPVKWDKIHTHEVTSKVRDIKYT